MREKKKSKANISVWESQKTGWVCEAPAHSCHAMAHRVSLDSRALCHMQQLNSLVKRERLKVINSDENVKQQNSQTLQVGNKLAQ